MTSETVERQFDIQGIPQVRVINVSGSVTVRQGPSGQVSVRAFRRAGRGQIEIGQDESGAVYARTVVKKKAGLPGIAQLRPPKVDYELEVPGETNLEVSGVNNRISLTGVSGRIELDSVNGDILAEDAAGDLILKTVNGRVDGRRLAGSARVNSVNGGITLAESDFPELRAVTVSGDLSVDTPAGAGPYEFKSVSGDVRMNLREGAGGRVIMNSVSGQVRLNGRPLPKRLRETPGSRRAVYEITPDGPDYVVRTVSGNFELTAADLPPIEEPAEDTAQDSGTMDILERISSGEISVDEGIEAMKRPDAG